MDRRRQRKHGNDVSPGRLLLSAEAVRRGFGGQLIVIHVLIFGCRDFLHHMFLRAQFRLNVAKNTPKRPLLACPRLAPENTRVRRVLGTRRVR